ncbi:MAG: histidine kinase [Bacteroidales bacterium]|nr:histidine kinase [Bacteroidales bacterium]
MLSDIYIKPDFKIFKFSPWHLIIPIIIGLIITLLAYPQGFLSVKIMSFVMIYSLAIGIPSMKSFEYIEWKLEQHISWLKRPNLRFFLTAFLEIIIGILILFTVNYLIFIVIQKQGIDILYSKTFEGLKYLIIFTITGVILINSSHFFKSWKQAAVNEEKLKREKLAIEYEALKNQVNPHFLFNSLTALSSLVYKDQHKAVTFIREFSNVFRYVLECREKEVVDLATEKKLLESISYLYQIRHEDSLQININLSDATDKFIIPMALQMLLENAIKHNTIVVNKPLIVEIREEEDYIVVRNNLQPKKTEIVSSKIGLENIKSRYKYLSDKEVLVEMSNENFVVKIPVLSIKDV